MAAYGERLTRRGVDDDRRSDMIRTIEAAVAAAGHERFKAVDVKTLQVNVGYVCNQACLHCHVGAGPRRSEAMTAETMSRCIDAAVGSGIGTVDITGGAPELNRNYRWFVSELKKAGLSVMTRTNLTVFFESGHVDLPEFLAENGVEVTASLPCYTEENVDGQRGEGVFKKSIEALRALNRAGYGHTTPLALNIVYNPGGAFLPSAQESLERDYRRELSEGYGIEFTRLFTIVNMPIGRFGAELSSRGLYGRYMETLAAGFNRSAVGRAMCRELVSVRWDGSLYDCDFNQALDIKVRDAPTDIGRFDYARLKTRRIAIGPNCYACFAGAGSSCTGATVKAD